MAFPDPTPGYGGYNTVGLAILLGLNLLKTWTDERKARRSERNQEIVKRELHDNTNLTEEVGKTAEEVGKTINGKYDKLAGRQEAFEEHVTESLKTLNTVLNGEVKSRLIMTNQANTFMRLFGLDVDEEGRVIGTPELNMDMLKPKKVD